jgi:hypothetical protein
LECSIICATHGKSRFKNSSRTPFIRVRNEVAIRHRENEMPGFHPAAFVLGLFIRPELRTNCLQTTRQSRLGTTILLINHLDPKPDSDPGRSSPKQEIVSGERVRTRFSLRGKIAESCSPYGRSSAGIISSSGTSRSCPCSTIIICTGLSRGAQCIVPGSNQA